MQGNLFEYEKGRVVIHSIHPAGCQVTGNNGLLFTIHVELELLKPILLTPDLLEKLGWERDPVPNGLRLNDPEHHWEFAYAPYVKFWAQDYTEEGYAIERGAISFFDGRGYHEVQYLHELQNIYRWTQGKPMAISW